MEYKIVEVEDAISCPSCAGAFNPAGCVCVVEDAYIECPQCRKRFYRVSPDRSYFSADGGLCGIVIIDEKKGDNNG